MDVSKDALSVNEIITATDKHMVGLGYSHGSMRHFREAWNVLKKYALSRKVTHMTSELGMAMLKEHYGIEMYSTNLSGYQNLIRRSVMLLLEFQLTGSIAKRMSRHDHTFPIGYIEIGEQYIQNLTMHADLKSGTIRNHHRALERFFKFAGFHGATEPGGIDVEIINAYIKTFAGSSKSHIAAQLRTFKSFCSYAYREGVLDTDFQWPTITIYRDRKIPVFYTADEIGKLLRAVDRANPRGKRDYAMLLLAAQYGFRVSDIKSLKFSNVDFANNEIKITQQKTEKPLTVPLLTDVGWALIDYIKNGRPTSTCPNIFIVHVAPYQSFSSNDNLEYLLTNYARAAGLKAAPDKKSSFHMLRYGLASELLRQNTSLTTISDILGHSELNTTSKYTRLDFTQLRVCALEVPV